MPYTKSKYQFASFKETTSKYMNLSKLGRKNSLRQSALNLKRFRMCEVLAKTYIIGFHYVLADFFF